MSKIIDIEITARLNFNVFKLLAQLATLENTEGITEADPNKTARKKEIIKEIKDKIGKDTNTVYIGCILVLFKKGIYLIPCELKSSSSDPTVYSDIPSLIKEKRILVNQTTNSITFNNQHVVDFYNAVFTSRALKYTALVNIEESNMSADEPKPAVQQEVPIESDTESVSSETFNIAEYNQKVEINQTGQINQTENTSSEIGKMKLRRPKYSVDHGPLSEWLSKEAFFLEMAGVRNEKDQVVVLIDSLTPDLTNGVLSFFEDKNIRAPTIKQLKVALEEANKMSGTDYAQQVRNTKYDSTKFATMQEYYLRLKALTKLSLGSESSKLSVAALDRLTTEHFRQGMPNYIKNSEAFDLSEAEGAKLWSLAQKLRNKKEKAQEINQVTSGHGQPFKTRFEPRSFQQSAPSFTPRKNLQNPNNTRPVKNAPNPQNKWTGNRVQQGARGTNSSNMGMCHYCNKPNHGWRECRSLSAAKAAGRENPNWKPGNNANRRPVETAPRTGGQWNNNNRPNE